MEKFIPYEKLSKKRKRALDAARRGSWGGLSPVTRRPEDPKAYKRKKIRIDCKEDDPDFIMVPAYRKTERQKCGLHGEIVKRGGYATLHVQSGKNGNSPKEFPFLHSGCRHDVDGLKTRIDFEEDDPGDSFLCGGPIKS